MIGRDPVTRSQRLNFDEKNNHGRIDTRRAAVKALTPVNAGLLSAHSAIKSPA